jgi:hypothetical protein
VRVAQGRSHGGRQETAQHPEATFKEFPRRQKAASFTIDQAHNKLAVAGGGK